MSEPPCESFRDARPAEQETLPVGSAAITGGAAPVRVCRSVPAKILPLRGLRLASPVVEERQMPEVTIDLQGAIDSLRLIRSDVEAFFWDYPSAGAARQVERYQISFWIRQIGDRTAALEGILMHKGATRLTVTGVGPEEEAALQAAAAVLDQWIREDESFDDVARKVMALLGAADRIGLRAAGGVPI